MGSTYLEKLIDETIRPLLGALELLEGELAETLQVPDAPWKILNKSYDELTEEEFMALMDMYHKEGEMAPCQMCQWAARAEAQRLRMGEKGIEQGMGMVNNMGGI